jgi:hypothetical protein
VEVTKFAQTKKSVTSSFICQDKGYFFFFNVEEIVHRQFVTAGKTVNQQFYLNVLKQLCDSLQQKHPGKWQSGDWFLYHYNAPAHTALIAQKFLAKNEMVVVFHHHPPPYSPDVAPYDFFLYPPMKHNLKGRHFPEVAQVQRGSLAASWPLTAFPLKILDNVSSNDSSARIAPPSQRGSSVKSTKVSTLYKYFKYIFCSNARNFWVPPLRPHSQPGHSGDERSLFPLPGIEPQFFSCPAHSLATKQTHYLGSDSMLQKKK